MTNQFMTVADGEVAQSGFSEFVEKLTAFFKSPFGTVLLFIIVAILGIILIKLLLKFIKKLSKRSKIEPTVFKFMYSIIKFVLYVLYFITLLAIVGVPITSLVAILTALTLGVTMALQSTVSNIVNGVILMANKPFKLGDTVEINNIKGEVIDINMFNTKLKTPTNEIITVSHNLTLDDNIIDYSHQDKRRVDINVSVSYDSDVDVVKEILKTVVKANEFVLQDEPIAINLTLMNASSLDFTVKVWSGTDQYWDCLFSMTEGVYKALKANNIEIPYQKIDVNIKNDNK